MTKLCLLSSPVLVLFSKVLYVREKVKFIWLLGDYRTRNVRRLPALTQLRMITNNNPATHASKRK